MLPGRGTSKCKDPETSEGLARSGSRWTFLGVLWVRVEKTLGHQGLAGCMNV